jgi:hypothetical protein
MTINTLKQLGFTDDEPFLASRVSLQKRAAANFAQAFSFVPPVKEVEPEITVEEFKFAD